MLTVHLTYLQLPVQSVPITAKVVGVNPVHGEMYLIQHYVIKFVSHLRVSSNVYNKAQTHLPILENQSIEKKRSDPP